MDTPKNTLEQIENEVWQTLSSEDRKVSEARRACVPAGRQLYDALTRPQLLDDIAAKGESMRDSIFMEVNRRIQRSVRRTFRLRLAGIAASIALLLASTAYFSYREGARQVNSLPVRLANPLGMRSSVVLSDGTRVVLNAGTTLVYPPAFLSGVREVEVCGEAFFEVVPDRKRPFIVRAERVKVQVLGTKFNVKAYREEERIEVTLVEGKVGVGLPAGKMIRIGPGQQVWFDKYKSVFSKREVQPEYYTAWKEGIFYFKNRPLAEIVRQLERHFNVRIEIASQALEEATYTGDFTRGENLEHILDVMTAERQLAYRIEADRICIYKKRRNR